MNDLKENDRESWDFLKDHFSISKSGISFYSIGSDHALEQKNRSLKVTGSVKGLTQESTELYRHCLIASSLNDISKEFNQRYNLEVTGRETYYQLNGSAKARIGNNVKKVIEVLENFDVNFAEESCPFNIVTKAVLPKSSAEEILNHQSIGQYMYQVFVNERINGDISLWKTINKRNLKTFQNESKLLKKKRGNKIVQLKEERTLLPRFLIAARKRFDLNLEEAIRSYELSVVPKSMFGQDGEPLITSDKAEIMHKVENLTSEETNLDDPANYNC